MLFFVCFFFKKQGFKRTVFLDSYLTLYKIIIKYINVKNPAGPKGKGDKMLGVSMGISVKGLPAPRWEPRPILTTGCVLHKIDSLEWLTL